MSVPIPYLCKSHDEFEVIFVEKPEGLDQRQFADSTIKGHPAD